MSYHPDPIVDGLVLVVVNDGDGTQCGLSYKLRCELQRRWPDNPALRKQEYRIACRRWDVHRVRRYGLEHGPRATLEQYQQAADVLDRYYSQHVKEMGQC